MKIATASVIEKLKGASNVARFFNITPQAISQWGKYVPRERALELMLRCPDEFPPEKHNGKLAA